MVKQRRRGASRRWIVFAAAVAATSVSVGQPQAYGTQASTITSVTGGAFGYYANVGHFGGPTTASGPAGTTGCDAASSTACSPSVTLPASGGNQPATDTDGATARYGPAVLFQSTSMEARSAGTTGDGGTVTSSARADGVGPGPFTAEVVTSTCTASGTGVNAAAGIGNGRLVTKTDPVTGEPVATEVIGRAPAANTTYTGTLDHVGDHFKAVVNEQISNPDGSTTVNALHLYLLGPTAVGELIVGQSVCGVASGAVPDAPSSSDMTDRAAREAPAAEATGAKGAGVGSSNPPAGPAASLAAAAAPAAAVAPAAAAAPAAVKGGDGVAFNYYTEVSLFGGDKRRLGYGQAAGEPPTAASPSVTCPPSGGPASATDADGAKAQYGPAVLFGGKQPADAPQAPPSGPMSSSIDCTLGEPGSVTAKTALTLGPGGGGGVGPGPFIADEVHSTCTGTTGSATIKNGKLETKYDKNTQLATVTEDVPESPAPNFTRTGTIDHVGDNYKIVFNEQIRNADGTLTVNAVHEYLLGPTAIGDMIIGQVRCGGTVAATSPAGSGTPAASGGGTPAAGTNPAGANPASGAARRGPGMATTGFGGMRLLLLAAALLVLGTATSVGGARLRVAARTRRPVDAGS